MPKTEADILKAAIREQVELAETLAKSNKDPNGALDEAERLSRRLNAALSD
jgi:hypothetical protein